MLNVPNMWILLINKQIVSYSRRRQ